MRQFFCNGEGNYIPVQLGIPFCERPEKGRNWFVQLLYSALGRWRRVTVIARVAHTNAVTALIPKRAEAEHALLTAGTVPFPWAALTQLLYEAFTDIAGAEGLVAAGGRLGPQQEQEQQDGGRGRCDVPGPHGACGRAGCAQMETGGSKGRWSRRLNPTSRSFLLRHLEAKAAVRLR